MSVSGKSSRARYSARTTRASVLTLSGAVLLSVLPVCLLLRLEEQQVFPGVCTHLSVQHVPVRTEKHVADSLPCGRGGFHDAADQTETTPGQGTRL